MVNIFLIVFSILFLVIVYMGVVQLPFTPKRKKKVKFQTVYGIVLILSPIVYYILVNPSMVIGEESEPNDQKASKFQTAILQNDFQNELIDQVEQKTYTLNQDQLYINENSHRLAFELYVKHNESLDKEIKLTLYQLNDEVNQALTPLKPNFEWSQNESTIFFEQPNERAILKVLSKEVPLRQMTGERWFDSDLLMYIPFYQAVLIEVPENVEVINQSNMNISVLD